jgi:hypothetical protein
MGIVFRLSLSLSAPTVHLGIFNSFFLYRGKERSRKRTGGGLQFYRSIWGYAWQHLVLDGLGKPAMAKQYFNLVDNITYVHPGISVGNPPMLWWLQQLGINQTYVATFTGYVRSVIFYEFSGRR